ncbi:hypothetical protein LL912_06400 [Niabella sp. CC-SYL272]|uniref:hypothetical protein n=1 Tax=Niabella agricola TaxID=2891571 RepID=UPI001F43B6B2|nr:hypothetical protein [Niabella agricola]MCF3108401.1 hypothetical protein [Niabella agricola]
MKFFVSIVSISVLSYISGIYLPWWGIAVAGFVVAVLLQQKPALSFWSGFIGVFLLWLFLAWRINAANDGILAGRIGLLLGIGKSPLLLAVITGVIGGVVAGLGALSASYLHPRIKK